MVGRVLGVMASVVMTLSASGAPAGESVSLVPRWTKGEVTQYEFSIESRQKAETIGETDSGRGQRLYQDGLITRRVVETDAKGTTLSFMYERARVAMSAGPTRIEFDSSKPKEKENDNELTGPVSAAIGRPILVRLGADGSIESIEGNEEPEAKDEADAKKVRASRSLVGDEIIRKVWQPMYGLRVKASPTAIGASWQTEDRSSQPSIGSLTVLQDWTLKAVEDGIARIEATGKVELVPAVGPMSANASLEDQSVKGTAEWDVAGGMLKSSETAQRIKIVGEGGGVKQSLDNTVTVTFKRADRTAPAKAAQ